MSAVRDLTHGATTRVAFEVERVGWPTADRLEVVGRWFGVRGRRFIRPTLYLDIDGEPRRFLAVLDHKPWAVEDGKEWTAAFAWEGEPVDLTGGELTVGPDIAVELKPGGQQQSTGRRFAHKPRADELESELEAMRGKVRRLTRELHAMRAEHSAYMVRSATESEAELERVRAVRSTAEREADRRAVELSNELDAERENSERLETALRMARQELAVARADAAAQREKLEAERTAVAAEASKASAEEVERLRAERDAARRESVNARAERDTARRESAAARTERDAAIARVRSEGEKRREVRPPTPAAPRPTEPTKVIPTPIVAATPPAAHEPNPLTRMAAIVGLVLLALVVVLLVVGAL